MRLRIANLLFISLFAFGCKGGTYSIGSTEIAPIKSGEATSFEVSMRIGPDRANQAVDMTVAGPPDLIIEPMTQRIVLDDAGDGKIRYTVTAKEVAIAGEKKVYVTANVSFRVKITHDITVKVK
jgi:hypothetical protein